MGKRSKNDELIDKINSKFKKITDKFFNKNSFVTWIISGLLIAVALFFAYEIIMKWLYPCCIPKIAKLPKKG